MYLYANHILRCQHIYKVKCARSSLGYRNQVSDRIAISKLVVPSSEIALDRPLGRL